MISTDEIQGGVMSDMPRYSLCELAFPDTTLEEDIEIAVQSGAEGLSIDEAKLGDTDPADVASLLEGTGIRPAACIPAVMTFLPAPHLNGPDDVRERAALMCRGVQRLAALGASSILCLTGPTGSFSPEKARSLSVESLRRVADEAGNADVSLSFETFRFSSPQNYSIVFGLEQALDLLDEAGLPELPLCYDIWQVWDSSEEILQLTRELAPRINVVHLNDYREPTRSWEDRVLPGDGVVDLPAIFGALCGGGYDSWFDLEVFSDDGRWGNDYPDSVWKLPWVEQAQLGRAGLMRAWRGSEHAGSGDS
jgi:sugar phosphate isomerase/epimerase